jgi:hypothetical protein
MENPMWIWIVSLPFFALTFVGGYFLGSSQAADYWKLTEEWPRQSDGFVRYTYGPYIVVAGAPGVRLEQKPR